MATTTKSKNPFRSLISGIAMWLTISLVAAGIVFGIFTGCSSYVTTHDKIWAGYSPGDADKYMTRVISHTYGLETVMNMKGVSREKTHLGQWGQQVWLYRLTGRRGVRYCVAIWKHTNSHNDSKMDSLLTRKCNY